MFVGMSDLCFKDNLDDKQLSESILRWVQASVIIKVQA